MATGREMEAREPASVTLIPDPVCGGGLKSTWGLGKQLFLFAGTQPFHQEERKGTLNAPTFIHHLKWDTEMHGPVTRKLANESRNVFKFLQTKVSEAAGSSLKSHLVKASHQYRAVLKACSIDLHEAAGTTVNEEERETLERQVQIYETIDLIWSLCEILFIDVSPGGVILTRLLEWLRWHFCEVESQAVEVVQTDPPDSHPEYWDTIYRFILQGRLDKARELLSSHPHRHLQGFVSMDELLRKMPLQATFNDNSLAVFDMKWRHWREEVIRRLETGEFSASNNLEKICRILMGDDMVFSELKDLCETWYHMLVSKMLYQNPTVQGSDLQYSAQSCMNEYGTGERRAELDNILMAALEYDIHQVINICSSVVGNWWFVVHLSDLFHHAGVLEAHQLPFGSNLREFLMLEYAAGLMSHKSLWQVGMDYLDYCPEYGRQYQELYLEHIPLDTEMKASKVLNACKTRDMQELAKGICRSMGMREIRNGRLGSALTWSMRSKDVAFATMIAEKYLTEYTDKGDFPDLDLLDSLGPSMLLSKRLTFLGKYREFHKLYGDGEVLAASELLLSLLTSKLAPRQFVMNLLIDALPLLECGEVVFTSEQTYELMHCLETLTTLRSLEGKAGRRQDSGEQIHWDWTNFEKEKVELIRLGLARNLARAILKEGSVTF